MRIKERIMREQETSQIKLVIDQLREELPPIFRLTEIDRLMGNSVRRKTINNMRSREEIPQNIFLRDGKRNVLVIRDLFLDWWRTRLSSID